MFGERRVAIQFVNVRWYNLFIMICRASLAILQNPYFYKLRGSNITIAFFRGHDN